MYVYIFKHTTYRETLDYRIATIGIVGTDKSNDLDHFAK